ncbi:Hpt domain-containing protein [Kaarinaea lacus]
MAQVVTDGVDSADKEQVLKQEILDALSDFIGSAPLGRYLSGYIDNTSKNIQSIGIAIASEDEERIRHLAHKLKGSSGNIGALKLAWNCVELEALTVEEQSQEILKQQYLKLEQVFQVTRDALNAYIDGSGVSQKYIV